MTDETGLPPDIALLWGTRETPRRGPKPSLTVGDIVKAAVEVADAEGLAAVPMARVAAQLGNSTMALYRHVKSKQDLLMLMADIAFEQPPDFSPGGDWRANLRAWAQAVMLAVSRHPWFATIPINAPPFGPNNLRWFDRALSTLAETKLAEAEKAGIVMGLMTYVRGSYRMNAELAIGFAQNPVAFSRQYNNALTQLVDPREYPALSKLVSAGVFDTESLWEDNDTGMDPYFDLGLEIYLDGMAAYIERRSAD
ncbi:AcrR family transcriptional regulator [Kibdelosporangium banguiense]|uniref:AcrR family transcriptional regulator n=1 Tax=Kibdelosporangium banguiense TaxID=1365924 RepID=A0ABS4TF86_9PSEU|nr:TetR/AcrR family transcriptional regulator [Kibdelosporangium banguiense]MBP2323068.1 AcrR family transcriptional regulator [Kibdelosporangium banguiense]